MTLARLPVLPLVAVLAFSIAACGGDDSSTPASCLPGCSGTRDYDARSYSLSGRFDWDTQALDATEDISLVLSAPATDTSAADDGADVVQLDSTVDVSRVHAGDQELAFAADTDTQTLRVDLAPLAPGGDPVTFTVEYQAPTSDSLIATTSRDDDPVTSRVVYTDSEPNRGHQWLVENDDPADRALWSVTLTVDGDEDVIGNGARTGDEPSGGGHRVSYALDKPIPTYMMAFAAGQLDHADRATGRVPLSVWYRRGLVLDPQDTLDVVARAMATFEDLVGPYPWDSYSVVLLPYGGGMENATITFNNETSGQGLVSLGLNAHELAHHWFGDWVTMHTYDDVWFKEGMATLLAAEATRPDRDDQDKGRLLAHDFYYYAGDAIVDPTLTGLSKYTSGPYDRAASLITQIRARVGEEAFWADLRQFLKSHALDSATGAEFVQSFAGDLDDATIQQILDSLPRTDVPSLQVAPQAAAGGGTDVTLTLSDPSNMLIAPVTVTAVGADGTATPVTLEPDSPATLTIPDGGYLAPDEADVHPEWPVLFDMSGNDYYGTVAPLLAPPPVPSAASTAFASRSAAQQEVALESAGLPALAASDLAGYVAALDSTNARGDAALDACLVLTQGTPADPTAWAAALSALLDQPALGYFQAGLSSCGTDLPVATFESELAGLIDQPTAGDLARLEYLMSFDYGADTLPVISPAATSAPALEVRDQALRRLVLQTYSFYGYSPVPPDQLGDWQSFFEGRLADITSVGRFDLVWSGIQGLGDSGALAQVAPLLHSVPMSEGYQARVVCQAYALSTSSPADWAAFQDAAQPWDTLGAGAAAALADPAACSQQRRLAPATPPRPGQPLRGGALTRERNPWVSSSYSAVESKSLTGRVETWAGRRR